MERKTTTLGFWGWVGVIMLLVGIGKFVSFVSWRAAEPEIKVSYVNFIFDYNAEVVGTTATVKTTSVPDIYIRVRPENAVAERAELSVSIDGKEVKDNCGSHGKEYFCYMITKAEARDGQSFHVVAKNTAGEKEMTVKVKVEASSSSSSGNSSGSSAGTSSGTAGSSGSSGNSGSGSSSGSSSNSASASGSSSSNSSSSSSRRNCWHYEYGRCWDDIEDEAASAGYFDRETGGMYGRSLDFGENCDSICQDIIEDAYYEGYEDL